MVTDSLDEAEIRHGSRIGRFVIVGELGSGGMGVVYAAHDRELDRQVALKVLRGTAATDEDRMRMLREGQAMARITHPNVITVYEVGIEGSLVFLAQELLDGGTLGKWLVKRRPESEILDKFAAAGRGLAAAHAAGLAHRDFKPDNVLLGKDGRVRVADFGLARALGAVGEALAVTTPGKGARAVGETQPSPMSQLTRTGAVMGTPMFMAPEQHNGERADERSDQFSFCVALYQALYDEWPFAGKTAVALAEAVIQGKLEPAPRRSRVSTRLRRILLRGLSTRPSDRYPSIEALLDELTHVPTRPLRKLMVAAGLVVLVGGAVVGGYALRSRSPEVPSRTPAPAPVAAPDVKSLTTDRGIEWLSAAVEHGQLDDAIEKYEMAAALKVQAGAPEQASIARSAGAVVQVMRGRLDRARARLREADADKGQDPIALAYADLATAMIASADGDLTKALERSRRCARQLATTMPVLAAMCLQLHGATAAELGDFAAARSAYVDGLALTRSLSPQRSMTLDLALAQLDLDEGQYDRAAASATALQASAAERGAASPEAEAWVLLARASLAQANTQKALEALDHVKPEPLQALRIRIEHKIASGKTIALLGDPDGLERIRAARTEAETAGFVGLAFEARLALVDALIATAGDTAEPEQRALVNDARARGYERVARLADTAAKR
ncbi:MAG: Serine/threonine kinase [Deltaproteobacteria bacterium]|nr:Serine/threonine kinase [Deltaproteobacteria bacterium]